eukprot:Skav236360  [mRNA]  locus=scaffold3883:21077:30724:+ [translate_table: standard]
MLFSLVLVLSLRSVRSVGAGSQRSLIRHEIKALGGSVLLTETPSAFETSTQHSPILETGCHDCCNDGHQNVACTDVDTCAKMAPKTGKYALILSYVGQIGQETLPFLDSAKAAAELAKDGRPHSLMSVPSDPPVLEGDVFFTNEDWLENGSKRTTWLFKINGGVILARNTHRISSCQNHQCSSNEQICLNDARFSAPIIPPVAEQCFDSFFFTIWFGSYAEVRTLCIQIIRMI